MTVQTAAGATLGITSSAPASYDANGYSVLAYTLVGELTDLGELGRMYSLVTHQPLASRSTVKRKGSYNEGTMSLTMGLDNKDAGQSLLRAAAVSDNDFSFCLTLQNGDRSFFPAQVMSFKRSIGSVDKIVAATASLELTSANGTGIIDLLAGAVVAPAVGGQLKFDDPANSAFIL